MISIYQQWRALHPTDSILAFVQWVERYSGRCLFDLLDPAEQVSFPEVLGSPPGVSPPPPIHMVAEGLESGP